MSHPFAGTPQYEQQYGRNGLGRPGNGLGDVSSYDPNSTENAHRARLSDFVGPIWGEEEPPERITLGDIILALEVLTAKQRFVIECRYGLRGDAMTQLEVSALMGIAQKNVHALEHRALEQLGGVLRGR